MAYFSNSSAGMAFDEQCAECKYGQLPCPIAAAQILYNYDAAGNDIATKILDEIVSDKDGCMMLKMIKEAAQNEQKAAKQESNGSQARQR